MQIDDTSACADAPPADEREVFLCGCNCPTFQRIAGALQWIALGIWVPVGAFSVLGLYWLALRLFGD